MCTGQTGHKPGGVPPKFFMFIGFSLSPKHQPRNHPHHHFGQLTRTEFAGRKLGPWSEFPFLYRFTLLLNSGGSNSPWSEFWSEFPHFMWMGVVPAPSPKNTVFQNDRFDNPERLLRDNFCCSCCASTLTAGTVLKQENVKKRPSLVGER